MPARVITDESKYLQPFFPFGKLVLQAGDAWCRKESTCCKLPILFMAIFKNSKAFAHSTD